MKPATQKWLLTLFLSFASSSYRLHFTHALVMSAYTNWLPPLRPYSFAQLFENPIFNSSHSFCIYLPKGTHESFTRHSTWRCDVFSSYIFIRSELERKKKSETIRERKKFVNWQQQQCRLVCVAQLLGCCCSKRNITPFLYTTWMTQSRLQSVREWRPINSFNIHNSCREFETIFFSFHVVQFFEQNKK